MIEKQKMNLVHSIFFNLLQQNKGNNTKKISNQLLEDLISVKKIPDNEEFNHIFDILYNNKHIREQYILGNAFPHDISYISKKSEMPFSNDIFSEIRWIFKTVSKDLEKINYFFRKKAEIDELVINEEYIKAQDVLNEVEKKIGVSFWSIEISVFLNKKISNESTYEIIDKYNNQMVSSIVGFFDMKASDSVESRDYDNYTLRAIDKFKRINNACEELGIFYNYMLAPNLLTVDNYSILCILKHFNKLPLIDKLLCAIDILEFYLTKQGLKNETTEYAPIVEFLDGIEAPLVNSISFLVSNNNTRIIKFKIDDDAEYLKILFISGELDKCYHETEKYIKTHPTNIKVFNLLIELCQILGKNPENVDVGEKKKSIIRNLNIVYSINNDYEDAISFLHKQCFYSYHSEWGRDIYNNINRYIQPLNSKGQVLGIKYSNIQKLTLETVCENLENEQARELLNNIHDTNNVYWRFWESIISKEYTKAAQICKVQQVCDLIFLKDKEEFELFENILSLNLSNINYLRVSKLLWDNSETSINIEKGIDYFIHLFVKKKEYVITAPIKKFVDYLNCDDANRDNIRVPIILYIYTTYYDCDRDDLFIACEDFFDINNIEKPSKMLVDGKSYTKEELIFFLRNICVPQILGPVLLSIRTSKGLDTERINICQNLCQINPESEEEYQQEIKEITQKIFINDSVSELENSKIHVNTEGIKQRISKEMKSVFNKFIYSRNEKINIVLEQVKNYKSSESISIISLDPSKLFDEMVIAIRNEFVMGPEYGLDSYLSLNIRHGTLAAQLRAPLATKQLLAEYDVEKEEYIINNRWLSFIPEGSSDYQKVKDAIIKLTKDTDNIIEYMRKELIQISTEDKPTNGIFRYHFDSTTITFLQTKLKEDCTFEEFMEVIFEELWHYTDKNLESMRKTIRTEIKQKYRDELLELQNTYAHLKVSTMDAERWINEIQNDMDAELERVSNWFVRGNVGKFSDFDLDIAFQVAFNTIKNIHPEKSFTLRVFNKDIKNKLNGKEWQNYFTVFYTLLDNICKHAKESNGSKAIDCNLMVDNKNVKIKMQNDFDCSKSLDSENHRMEKARELIDNKDYLIQAKKEGGSGIPKIYKIFKVDLHMDIDMLFDFDKDNNKFILQIEGKYK